MAFFDFYRQNMPMGGGDILTPPQPFYQPQPSWGGVDFYRAQAQAADSSLYEYGLERVRALNLAQGASGVGIGAGLEEARILHRRAYFGEMKMMMPADIGAAAAFEAWRNWSAYQGIYMQPLSADRDMQREALIGMSIGEAARLWNYTANPMDVQGRLAAVEGAAATAAKIFVQSAAGIGGRAGVGMGGSPLLGSGTGLGMGAGPPLMGAGAGLGVGGMDAGLPASGVGAGLGATGMGAGLGPGGLGGGLGVGGVGMGGGLSPGFGPGAMGVGAGGYLDIPQRPFMRRRSMSDLAAAGMAGGAGMGGMGYGAGMPYGSAGVGALGYGGADLEYGGGMPYGGMGMGYGGAGAAGLIPGAGAGYGMGGPPPNGLSAAHPLATTAGYLAGELEGGHRRRHSRSRSSRRHRRRRSDDGGYAAGAFAPGGLGSNYAGYGGGLGGGYGGGYGSGYGGYGSGYGHRGGALAAGLAAGAQGYAATR